MDRTKIYDLVEIARKVLPNARSVYMCGAGAGPHTRFGTNCEVQKYLIQNEQIKNITFVVIFLLLGNFQFEN